MPGIERTSTPRSASVGHLGLGILDQPPGDREQPAVAGRDLEPVDPREPVAGGGHLGGGRWPPTARAHRAELSTHSTAAANPASVDGIDHAGVEPQRAGPVGARARRARSTGSVGIGGCISPASSARTHRRARAHRRRAATSGRRRRSSRRPTCGHIDRDVSDRLGAVDQEPARPTACAAWAIAGRSSSVARRPKHVGERDHAVFLVDRRDHLGGGSRRRTSTPYRAAAVASGGVIPGCSSVVVTTRSPGRQSIAPTTVATP